MGLAKSCAVCGITLNDKITAKKRDGELKLDPLDRPYCLNCDAMYGKPEPEEKSEDFIEMNGVKVYIGYVFKHHDCDEIVKITGFTPFFGSVNESVVYYTDQNGDKDWMVLCYLMEHYERIEE